MKNLFLFASLLLTTLLHSQNLEVEGDIKISSSGDPNPASGTIRWSGTDFLGWNGTKWISLTSGVAFEGEVTDIDGNTYRTIKIGAQEWMAENLRTTRYANNTEIPQENNHTTWQNANYGAWSWYDTSSTYDLPYGKLYNWYAVNDGRGLCPTGWREPTDAEWTSMIDFLDPGVVDPNATGSQSTVSAGKMKEAALAHWNSPNAGATNESGWWGLPGGLRAPEGIFGNIGNFGGWWSSTAFNTSNAFLRSMFHDNTSVNRGHLFKEYGFSVRCLRD